MTRIARPATAEEIVEITGRLDGAVLMRIVATGATPAEVLQGFIWARSDDRIGIEPERRPRGVAAQVCGILKQKVPGPDDGT